MDTDKLQDILSKHRAWLNDEPGGERLVCWGEDLAGANLSEANLSEANLTRADLSGANLTGADLDYSCWPLWCGSKNVKVDTRIAAQLAGHGAVVDVQMDDDTPDDVRQAVEEWQAACRKLGKFSHRAKELGLGVGFVEVRK